MSEVLETKAEERPSRTDQRIARWWQLAPTVLSVLALFTSGAVFLAVFLTTRSADQARLRLEYVRVAVAILKPAKPTEPQKELRRWAVDVLNVSAEVKLSDAQADALINGESAFPYGTDYGYGRDGGDYGGYEFRRPVGPERPEPSAPAKPDQ